MKPNFKHYYISIEAKIFRVYIPNLKLISNFCE